MSSKIENSSERTYHDIIDTIVCNVVTDIV